LIPFFFLLLDSVSESSFGALACFSFLPFAEGSVAVVAVPLAGAEFGSAAGCGCELPDTGDGVVAVAGALLGAAEVLMVVPLRVEIPEGAFAGVVAAGCEPPASGAGCDVDGVSLPVVGAMIWTPIPVPCGTLPGDSVSASTGVPLSTGGGACNGAFSC